MKKFRAVLVALALPLAMLSVTSHAPANAQAKKACSALASRLSDPVVIKTGAPTGQVTARTRLYYKDCGSYSELWKIDVPMTRNENVCFYGPSTGISQYRVDPGAIGQWDPSYDLTYCVDGQTNWTIAAPQWDRNNYGVPIIVFSGQPDQVRCTGSEVRVRMANGTLYQVNTPRVCLEQ